ncbi:hypothetical protein GLOIN_2v1786332 [Rhizophagus irregularis DAOM 181602=DAOM 197198]|uniref:BED-type domain-containing protein n=1 Tax=Rhizophagus irregularis (strain DAOM 181602 / DAOM 197198 / MUCL 43194) TaxID=747089 RepID=A0A2P4P8D5_RHIID|nr:hypothetical protein GLOIN_2v1786332 [Rhizophagus irregularis DAOM 181602=DAOM 197198]POG61633.1 hypothetical protein GLOIN_2v1786332 [Rhizophagus irregularis DAOM 181602=DAOM 197198]|eukprot:XP_025168499.1 hypothetical protein GLOIN_2v1786332 [Rhizophagus irregularis DAOM 181602=DAOM 197198]
MTRIERKKGPVWKHFNSINKNDATHLPVQCIYCLKDFQRAVPERMQAHLDNKCPKAPTNAKSQSSQQSNTTSIIDYAEEVVRKKGPVWKDFSIIGKREDSHPNVQCKYCFKEFKRAVPQRMQIHIEKCEQAPNNVKSKLKQSRQQNTIKINEINDCMSEEEQKFLESLLVKAAEIHFSFVDNPSVIEFFNHLQPSFKIPNGEEIKIQLNQSKPLNDITYHPEYYHQLEIGTEDKGDINSMNNVEYYDYGVGHEIATFELYKEAADKDDISSMYNFGYCYSQGIGIERNENRAFELYKEVAENGDLDSLYNLEYCYSQEIGTRKNEIKAFELYKEAAEKGDIDSTFNLGICYEDGTGTEKNEIKAFELYKEAAEKGDLDSMYQLGYCYRYGVGIEINVIKSFEYYNKAAERMSLIQ